MKNTTQAFTLIELLIVIAIVGILATILIPNLLSSQKRAYDSIAVSCASALHRAVQIYHVDHPLTSEVPDVSTFYGDASKEEFYGTKTCNSVAASSGSIITGPPVSDGKYVFTIKHGLGRNTYTLTPQGISAAATP